MLQSLSDSVLFTQVYMQNRAQLGQVSMKRRVQLCHHRKKQPLKLAWLFENIAFKHDRAIARRVCMFVMMSNK